ncbi:hypothetical protein NL676_034706 [Syzygium grande]|nr:hypothetical protein NL676_034706 [Syzygium grande]
MASRPEIQAPPEILYTDVDARKYIHGFVGRRRELWGFLLRRTSVFRDCSLTPIDETVGELIWSAIAMSLTRIRDVL